MVAAFAAFSGPGQTCVCGARILVQESIYPASLDKIKAKAALIRVGEPAGIRTQLGPVISERSRARILAKVERGAVQGAKVLSGGIPEGTVAVRRLSRTKAI
jgi:phenylacetaldehyde dehydrogenase